MKTYNYDFIFCDIYGRKYEEVHLKNVTPKEYNRYLCNLKIKYKVSENKMSLKWI